MDWEKVLRDDGLAAKERRELKEDGWGIFVLYAFFCGCK